MICYDMASSLIRCLQNRTEFFSRIPASVIGLSVTYGVNPALVFRNLTRFEVSHS